MKYMGSKRAMLQNGLGHLIQRELSSAARFVDLFAGSATVAVHVAREFPVRVLAFDLQQYSVVLASAVLRRQAALDCKKEWKNWYRRAQDFYYGAAPPELAEVTRATVNDARHWCADQHGFPITKAYGGHYFSPSQAIWIDAFRATLPRSEPLRTVSLAALVRAGSACVAAPGHTAQPFQPTRTAKEFLIEAWARQVTLRVQNAFTTYRDMYAKRLGQAKVADANEAAGQLREKDLVFVDPPYSGVHYSRFYHVLETIAGGRCEEVSGTGRYPPPDCRPRSRYSVQSEAEDALDDLLDLISSAGATAILTFPDHACSNGLSGEAVRDIASEYFRVSEAAVATQFSTLGGTSADQAAEGGRAARHKAHELILLLKPH